jgi:hypothetical protein
MRMSGRATLYLLATILGMLAADASALDRAAPEPARVRTTALPPSRNLWPIFERFKLVRRDQGGRNTCSVFTMAGAMEFALAKRGRPGVTLSIEFLNWASSQVTGRSQDGSFFSNIWRGFEKYGVCPEADMPYGPEFDPARAPSPEALKRAEAIRLIGLQMHWIKEWDPTKGLSQEQLNEVRRVLSKGWPVCGGFLWPKDGFERWDHDVLAMVPREHVRDGHSVLLVGYRDDPKQPGGGVFLIRNSSPGPRRSAMSYEYIRAYMNDALWIEPAKKSRGTSAPR